MRALEKRLNGPSVNPFCQISICCSWYFLFLNTSYNVDDAANYLYVLSMCNILA